MTGAMTTETNRSQLVLIVDADSANTSQLVNALKDHHLESVVVDANAAALEHALADRPLLILSEVAQEAIDGIELYRQVRANPALQETPFVFIARQTELDERLKLLDLDIDDYIAKPYYPEEVVARIESILRESAVTLGGELSLTQGFTGSLEEMSLADLVQTLELGKKSATIHLVQEPEEGFVFVDKGEVVDAILRDHNAEEAFFNLMLWLHGYFELTMQPVQREVKIHRSNRELLLTGSQRLHDYKTRAAQLPSMDSYVARAAGVVNPELTELESRIWTILERPQPIRLLLASLQDDELRTIEVIQALWERKFIMVYPGTVSDTDLIARNILLKAAEAKQNSADPYSRIASLFVRNGHQKKNLT
jgi:DNA-binding response OmpR family regulator